MGERTAKVRIRAATSVWLEVIEEAMSLALFQDGLVSSMGGRNKEKCWDLRIRHQEAAAFWLS